MGRREIAVGKTGGQDGFSFFAVQSQALGLPIFLVPGEAKPAQPLKNRLHAGIGVALNVCIVKAQHHGAVVMACVEPVENERAGAADV